MYYSACPKNSIVLFPGGFYSRKLIVKWVSGYNIPGVIFLLLLGLGIIACIACFGGVSHIPPAQPCSASWLDMIMPD
jgi:hypothetical protein